ncbi:hypothetical protein [Vibrio mexicanus]|uniref:hypothetical protein n=1 Tax=Vibrio mexicanus TaxID=1004326 RepID=UPI00063C2BFB|nr:hypothetical protein [Vibrio mexicanus]
MFYQSKILVWYQVASQKVVLGEAFSDDEHNVVSLWHQAPQESYNGHDTGFRLSLFDDDGREVADKAVSMVTADEFLSHIVKASA